MILDFRSLALMTCLTSAAMGFVLLTLRRHYPPSIRGMGPWGVAPVVLALATILYWLEPWLTASVVMVLANGLLMLGAGLFYVGTGQFLGRPVRVKGWLISGVLVLLWHVYFFDVQPDYRLRLSVFTCYLFALGGCHIALLLRHGQGFGARLTVGVLALQNLVWLVRGLSTFWLDEAGTARFDQSPMQAAYLLTYLFSVLMISVGMLLMASERLRSEFENLANHDSLTGALSRRAVLEVCAQSFSRWQRYGQGFALLMVDVDWFKQINDRHGHAVGDQVLVQVVQDLGHTLRAVDRLGRYGGEEFLVMLPEVDLDKARTVAERMRLMVEQRPGSPSAPACTISIGLACVRAGDASLSAVLSRADAALYAAKRRGRNSIDCGEA
jgi:diguanylate cyclase (GGDEF)-like protein